MYVNYNLQLITRDVFTYSRMLSYISTYIYIYIYNRKTIFQEKTVNITRLTHTHPLAIVGAILQSFAVQLALSLDNSQPLDTSAFLDELLDRLRPVEKEIYDHHKQMKKEENQEEEKSGDKRYLLFRNVGRTVLC